MPITDSQVSHSLKLLFLLNFPSPDVVLGFFLCIFLKWKDHVHDIIFDF